ncbi:MAG: beta-ketoacyl-ACP synthase II [Candidatus Omnitrophica bacterium]|nr:beta-ketoacyl-ACP synthase II [Candidatus Omnitrophota bacterium]
MTKRRVVVTGIGVISPIGSGIDAFWRACCEGKSGVSRITQFDATGFDTQIAAEVRGFDPSPFLLPKEAKRTDRFVQFAVAGAVMATEDAGLDLAKENLFRAGVVVGSGIGGLDVMEEQHNAYLKGGPGRLSPFLIPMLIVNMAPGQISIKLGLKGPNSCVATACSSGNHAIGDSLRIIQRGEADVMYAGGTEACITRLGVGGFCALKALSTRNDAPERASRPFDVGRDGFVMGEGAAIVILEELERARRRGARIYAELTGYGMTSDAYHMTAPAQDGEGASRCMLETMKDAGVHPADIDYINAHGTSTPLNDKMETLAIKSALGEKLARSVSISSTKSMTGHLLGAAGGIEFAITSLALYHGIIPPTINYENQDPECDLDYTPNKAEKKPIEVAMSNSFGFGGHNATLIARRLDS